MQDFFSIDELNALFPNFTFERFLSQGGQKIVYKGRKDKVDVVIKFIPIDNMVDHQRILREISCMQEIDSPNLVKILDCFSFDIPGQKIIVIVENFVNGVTLREKIISSPSLKLSIDVLQVLLNLLEKFEKKKIIHRDIKPENIMISNDGNIVLLDFGIARIIDKDSLTHSRLPMAPGTFPYCAPEQINNKKKLQDVRTDLYSCGIVFFEAATGDLPFERDDYGDFTTAKLDGRCKSLKDCLPPSKGSHLLDEMFYKLTNYHQYERFRKPSFAIKKLEELKEALYENRDGSSSCRT
jgi:eukaryotic-like serine/threonine-protein kinase